MTDVDVVQAEIGEAVDHLVFLLSQIESAQSAASDEANANNIKEARIALENFSTCVADIIP